MAKSNSEVTVRHKRLPKTVITVKIERERGIKKMFFDPRHGRVTLHMHCEDNFSVLWVTKKGSVHKVTPSTNEVSATKLYHQMIAEINRRYERVRKKKVRGGRQAVYGAHNKHEGVCELHHTSRCWSW